MIQGTDYRIGNYVTCEGSIPVRITALHYRDGVTLVQGGINAKGANIEPIPLSPEILENCDFYFRSEPKTQGGFVKQFEKSILELFHIPHNFGSWHVIMTLSPVHSIGITVIKHVHELQNLIYSLYKTELNVKL